MSRRTSTPGTASVASRSADRQEFASATTSLMTAFSWAALWSPARLRPLISSSPYLERRRRRPHWEPLLQPLRDEAVIGVDVYALISVRPRREFVRGVGGHHKDLPGMASQFLGSNGEHRPTTSDDECFGVRMLVQPWAHTRLRRRLQDDRNAGVTW